jgi:gliding motility-associatede transport system auxiliary component
VEGVKTSPAAKVLGLIGLVLMAGGGLFYAISLLHDVWGLAVAGGGLLLVLVAALIARKNIGTFFSRRSARLGLGTGVAIVAVLALVIFLGALANRHHWRMDFSQGQSHTLAPQTIKVLKGLKDPVKAYAFFKDNQAGRRQAEDELAKYGFHNRLFSYQFINPDAEPGMAKRFKVRAYGTVVLVAGKKEERVQLPEEQALTNALVRLTRKGKKTVYFLSGHGEPSLDGSGKEDYSQLKKAITQNNYQVKSLLLATSSQVPPDASLLIIAGPRKDLLAQEKQRISAYLAGGGGLLIMLDPISHASLKGWLGKRGVLVGDDLVLDENSSLFGMSPAVPMVMQYGFHDITKPLEGTFCFFPEARSISLQPKLPEGATGVELIKTSANSWAETDLKALETGEASFEKEQGDTLGPISLGVALTVTGKKPAAADKPAPKGNLVVLGDSEFANNNNLDQAGNRDLVLNSISWLAEEEDLVSIRAKKRSSQPLLLQPAQARMVFWLPVVAWPLALAVLGAFVVIRRRKSR